jgi:hypothetical protein
MKKTAQTNLLLMQL